MRGVISLRAAPLRKQPPPPHPNITECITQHWLVFGIIPRCSLYHIMKCSVILDFLNSLQVTDTKRKISIGN